MSKVYLLKANYEKYDFSELYNEAKNKDYKGILWHNSNRAKISVGDIVYIYYCNMPDNVNRILIRSKVRGISDKKIYNQFTDKYVDGFFIEGYKSNEVKGIFPKEREKFGTKNLREKYGFQLSGRSIYELKPEKYTKLLKDLEETTKREEETKNFGEMKEIFYDVQCPYIPKEHNKYNFKKENGLNYFEIHHFIFQSILRKYKLNELKSYIYNPNNEITLCANCHRRIHHASQKERKKMVDYFYEKQNIKENVEKIYKILKKQNKIQNKTAKDWLYELYALCDR